MFLCDRMVEYFNRFPFSMFCYSLAQKLFIYIIIQTFKCHFHIGYFTDIVFIYEKSGHGKFKGVLAPDINCNNRRLLFSRIFGHYFHGPLFTRRNTVHTVDFFLITM